jgi:hypothetical protein
MKGIQKMVSLPIVGVSYSLCFYLVRVLGLVKVKFCKLWLRIKEKVSISIMPNRHNMKIFFEKILIQYFLYYKCLYFFVDIWSKFRKFDFDQTQNAKYLWMERVASIMHHMHAKRWCVTLINNERGYSGIIGTYYYLCPGV